MKIKHYIKTTCKNKTKTQILVTGTLLMSKSNPAIISEVNFLLVINSKIIILVNKILVLSFYAYLYMYYKISILIQSETCLWLLLL